MSAINPASFASQPLGLQAPSGIGPGAVGVGRGGSNNERRPNQSQEQVPATFSPQTQAPPSRQFPGPANQGSFTSDRAAGVPATTVASPAYPANFPYGPYAAFGNVPRAPAVPYNPAMIGSVENYPSPFGQASDFQAMRARFPSPQASAGQHEPSISPLSTQGDWMGAFQGLSLNTR
jgi:hypothetical protein